MKEKVLEIIPVQKNLELSQKACFHLKLLTQSREYRKKVRLIEVLQPVLLEAYLIASSTDYNTYDKYSQLG